MDCRVDTGKISEYYMLTDETWYKIHNSQKGMLCIGCVEARLGRKLNKSDFKPCHLNRMSHCGTMSVRLLERINAEK